MRLESPDNDAWLWQRFKEGDSEALGQLMTDHYTALIRYGTRFTRDTDFVRDCMQDIFVELWNRRETVSLLTSERVRPYLMTMLRRLLHQQFLERQRYEFEPVSEQENGLVFDVTFSPEDMLIETEQSQHTADRIRQLLNQLPRRSKEAIYLRFYDNLDRAAIAQVMGISEQSVSNLFQETFRLLRRHVQSKQLWLFLLAHLML